MEALYFEVKGREDFLALGYTHQLVNIYILNIVSCSLHYALLNHLIYRFSNFVSFVYQNTLMKYYIFVYL